jgi:hypothetical protein
MWGMNAAGTSNAKGDRAARRRLNSIGGRAMCVALATGTNAARESRSSCASVSPCSSRCRRMLPNTSSTAPACQHAATRAITPPDNHQSTIYGTPQFWLEGGMRSKLH